MLKLTRFTQTIFCLVSMALTSLFALSLSGINSVSFAQPDEKLSTLLLACIFILIGCCIDIGKYLFWMFRSKSKYFITLSIILMIFSWVASCAFLLTSESTLLGIAQTQSGEYKALEQRISNVSLDIASQEVLLANQLESSYHSQWQAGQNTAEYLKGLRESLAALLEVSTSVGKQSATNEVATTQFFQQVGESVHLTTNTVRLIGYALLSLLLELSTLGMISLAQFLKHENNQLLLSKSITSRSNLSLNREVHLTVVKLVSDIVNGKIPPVLRKIQSAKYGIEIDITRHLLNELLQAGIIEKDKRNSYKLSR